MTRKSSSQSRSELDCELDFAVGYQSRRLDYELEFTVGQSQTVNSSSQSIVRLQQ